ncbi:chromatin modification-related protein EAF1 B isoform X4 [Arabidopsis lyrata subsp. lyrata]|uniref:chromatin modification-related protein EAF1 B isoform X4 n=1 Tax=Arabidopsis lyrata subsp. lyrata TaxID=81972 RepID=UPI000A29AE01|nr:chromatin modification-related protein EAF1 B isoform X4 [Arabidopsis lyrata subsp. lyrata]|eukprot:XP_020886117.1 chromatin modification-related protein EAF1 B isoform X4 [Arabidopsis lyrata subsp. lyrata]
MHGSVSGFLLVNAQVDSMGGVIDSGGGIGVKTSPRRTAIEKAQAELRQEYDVREERRRELEFLEKGGNPLDFKFGIATSHSVQSTSLTDQQAEHFINSEVKDSFALTASPHGDSVESSGRPGVPTISEPNTADNLLLFDSENKSVEGERNLRYPNRQNRTSDSERSSKANTNQNTKETEDSAIFRPYARRNRSKINRDPARSSSTDLVQNRGGLATSISIRRGSVEGKGCIPEAANQKDRHTTSVSCPIFANTNGNNVPKNRVPSNSLNTKVDGEPVVRESTAGSKTSLFKDEADITYRKRSAYLPVGESGLAGEKAQLVSSGTEIGSPKAATIAGQENNSTQLNGLRDSMGEEESLTNRGAAGTKGIKSESSHANNVEVDVDNERDLYKVEKLDSDEISMQKTLRVEGLLDQTVGEITKTKIEDETGQSTTIITECIPEREMQMKSVKIENQSHRSTAEMQNEEKGFETEKRLQDGLVVPKNDRKVGSILPENPSSSLCSGIPQASVDTSSCTVGNNLLSGTDIESLKHQPSSDAVVIDTVKEDSILEEARIIQAKRKRIAELSFGTAPVEVREKSQWDFVLEEMAWLANDFAQERLWKMTAAAQICHRVALTCQLRFEERNQHKKLKKIASVLSNAILEFWSSVEVPGELEETSLGIVKETCQESNCVNGRVCLAGGVKEYASRFLKYNNSSISYHSAAPSTPDNMCNPEILDISMVDQLTEASLFYSVPSGAMEVYHKSIESHLTRCEKSGSSMQEEVDTSAYDTAGGYNVTAFDEDEGETSTYYLPGAFESSRSFNISHKKRKNLMKSHSARSYDLGDDLPYVNYTGGSNSSSLMAKRSASNINTCSVPTRRVRTASRQRIVSPFGCATAGNLPVPSKTDASSGDTSSFQDEQSSLHGGSAVQKGTEVESSVNFEKMLPYDMAETSGKPKKKKKTHQGSAYDQTWHLDPSVHVEQVISLKDHWKKRPENHFDMNASQMSNMSNPNKSIKFIGGRDRARKIKGLKISPGQHGSGNPWSLFEDQALVVLVHDMGPNWELISDAMNSTLKIKCIYRNPTECKERHKILMDKTAGDGADSAEDSGNSQSYPSTLPGIPKGSARQLFQRLQGPMEEDTLKSHFEKICLIGKKLHYRKTQNDGRDPKQIVPVHNSQVMALSQVFPNNLNGGVLTPLDVCDASTSGQDVFSLENPGLPMLNQGTPVLPTSGAHPSTPGSSGVVLSNNLPTTSGLQSASVRDGRFNVPRGSLPLDEQHRLQQFNQMLSGRNLQQPSLSTPGAVSGSDRGHRMVPGGNAMGVTGMNRNTPMSRPGFQGMASSAMPNTGSMLSSGMVGIPNTGNVHSGGGASQGSSMHRPREAVQHMMRMQAAQGNSPGIPAFSNLSSGFTNQTTPVQAYPGQLSQQHQMSPQSHVLGNSHHPHLQSPSQATGAQQEAFAIRQRQIHQRYLQQQQQQFPASGTMMPHVQQPQGSSVSSSPQNSPQTQPPVSPQPLSMPPVSPSPNINALAQQNPKKSQLPLHGLGRSPQSGTSGVNNQAGKQRQRQLQQQLQQSARQHPHQRQPTQGQQQNKKGMGRGNMIYQNITVDQSHLNGLNMAPGNQATEKGESAVPVRPDQQSSAGTTTSTHMQSKPFVPPLSSNHSQQLPKSFPGASSPSQQQMQLHSDNNIQGQTSPAAPCNILSTSSPSITPAVPPSNHQHLLIHQKQRNQVQSAAQRVVHHNHLGNSELSKKSQAERMPRVPLSVTNTTQTASMGTTKGMHQASNDLKNIKAVDSTAVPALEPPSCVASVQSTASKVVNSSNTDSAGNDPVTTPNQGLAQEHLSGGLPSHGIKGVTQRQQQSLPSEEKRPKLPEKLTVLNQKHLASEQQQQPQLEEALEVSSSKPPDTKVE